jgi:hypothetical protein
MFVLNTIVLINGSYSFENTAAHIVFLK